MKYRDFDISYDPPPIPARNCDWQFWHIDYDGPEDLRCGWGASWRECIDEIDDFHYYDEGELPCYTLGDGVDGSLNIANDETLLTIASECYGRQFRALVDRCQQRRYGAS